MSRIGKKSIEIPDKVKLAVSDTGSIKVEGPKGKQASAVVVIEVPQENQ